MSLWSNEMRVVGDVAVVDLLTGVNDLEQVGDAEHFHFTLADPMLQGTAKRGASWDPNDHTVRIGIDFDRASWRERDIQARLQADFFGPIIMRADVDSVALDHEDYWHVLRRAAGRLVVTDRDEAIGHVLTVAMCSWFDDRGIAYTRADLGRP